MRVDLGSEGELTLTSRIRNTNADGKPFTFTFAYHTYFSVSDIRYSHCIHESCVIMPRSPLSFAFIFSKYLVYTVINSYIYLPGKLWNSNFGICIGLLVISEVRVEGLETLDYLDNLKNRERFTEQGDAITFESEVSLRYPSF